MTVILSHREGRASLASVAHRTHFQTLSNVARNGSAWPDNTDGADPSKVPDLPVRRRHSPVLARHRKPSLTFFLFISWHSYHTRSSRATQVLMEVHGTRNLRDRTQCDRVWRGVCVHRLHRPAQLRSATSWLQQLLRSMRDTLYRK
jgi:hypothetical protein